MIFIWLKERSTVAVTTGMINKISNNLNISGKSLCIIFKAPSLFSHLVERMAYSLSFSPSFSLAKALLKYPLLSKDFFFIHKWWRSVGFATKLYHCFFPIEVYNFYGNLQLLTTDRCHTQKAYYLLFLG